MFYNINFALLLSCCFDQFQTFVLGNKTLWYLILHRCKVTWHICFLSLGILKVCITVSIGMHWIQILRVKFDLLVISIISFDSYFFVDGTSSHFKITLIVKHKKFYGKNHSNVKCGSSQNYNDHQFEWLKEVHCLKKAQIDFLQIPSHSLSKMNELSLSFLIKHTSVFEWFIGLLRIIVWNMIWIFT